MLVARLPVKPKEPISYVCFERTTDKRNKKQQQLPQHYPIQDIQLNFEEGGERTQLSHQPANGQTGGGTPAT